VGTIKKNIHTGKQPQPGMKPGKTGKFFNRIEKWCNEHRLTILILILFVSALFRIIYFIQLNRTDVMDNHRWSETDMSFFDQWAKRISGGDILSDTAMHPIHGWTKVIANEYLRRHPDTLKVYKEQIGSDTIRNTPEKMLWNRWYGGKQFHQEPLYPYFVGLIYKLFGPEVRWIFFFQMIAGVLINLLVYLVTRRYFGDLAAVIAAFITVFFGPLLFNDLVLLRTTFTSFMAILLPYLFGIASDKQKGLWWLIFGFICGLAFLLNAFFIVFLTGIIILMIITQRKQIRKLALFMAAIIIGAAIALTPLICRNAAVGSSLVSTSSTGAISFITENNDLFKSFIGWKFDSRQSVEIMEQSEGSLTKSIFPTLRTHPDPWSYLSQVWEKFHAIFSWYEVANNTNFFFYRAIAPVLFIAFFTFLLLTPLALAGLALSIVRKSIS
jgi:hypothetical protein